MDEQAGLNNVIHACQNSDTPALIEVNPIILAHLDVDQVLRNSGYFVARLDEGVNISNKEILMKRLDIACGFPDYFGFNWDATKDCLADFSWHPAQGYILIFKNPQLLNVSDARILVDIISEVSKLWADEHISFKLLVPAGFLEFIA